MGNVAMEIVLGQDERLGPHRLKHRSMTGTKGDKRQACGHKNDVVMHVYDHSLLVVRESGTIDMTDPRRIQILDQLATQLPLAVCSITRSGTDKVMDLQRDALHFGTASDLLNHVFAVQAVIQEVVCRLTRLAHGSHSHD